MTALQDNYKRKRWKQTALLILQNRLHNDLWLTEEPPCSTEELLSNIIVDKFFTQRQWKKGEERRDKNITKHNRKKYDCK